MSEPITNLADAVAALGALPMPVGPAPRTLDQVEEELTGVSLSLYEEELDTDRLRLALKSAQRRARRRQPHEREGLIFHLERENKRLHSFVRVANEAALVSHRGWEQYSGEAASLREENARLRARVSELEARVAAEECRCPEPAPLCEGCRCKCHAEQSATPADAITRLIAPTQALHDDVTPQVQKLRDLLAGQRSALEAGHESPLHHSYRAGRDLPEQGGA